MSGKTVPSTDTSAPGDEAPPGTSSTGEIICPDCGGSGKRGGERCPACAGSGKVVKAIGGAGD